MKIGMMTLWNCSGGPSIHAELIGREWVRMGHELIVFSNFKSDFPRYWQVDGQLFPHEMLVREDEPYVVRNFTIPSWTSYSLLDTGPILNADFDVFVAQNLELLPMRELLKVFPKIKAKAKTVLILHEGRLPQDPDFYRFSWDSVVCFDERYLSLFRNVFPHLKIIRFPCHPWKRGDKEAARKKLGLPLDRKIVLIFGFRVEDYSPIIPPLAEVNSKFPLTVLVLSSNHVGINKLLSLPKGKLDMRVRKGLLKVEDLYEYLHAADALCIYRKSEPDAVVLSSTAYLALGSGCPLVVSDCNYFEDLDQEVMKYSKPEELKDRLLEVFEGQPSFKRSQHAAKEFVRLHSSEKIAQEYIQLFESLSLEARLVAKTPMPTTA
ncbi:hypothetical protein [Candidatus Hecatella orcuttiae]|jgi:glycosyltransferase involved in cell wall biosynthesis|uniref:hypothetical protein n=1 Tax=Candidatus Hecatella orcuttiae TaxID=1935119 RepID=UPI002867F8EE|nr:hypothetical protein [Candidatus Hecatella orcuttiae]